MPVTRERPANWVLGVGVYVLVLLYMAVVAIENLAKAVNGLSGAVTVAYVAMLIWSLAALALFALLMGVMLMPRRLRGARLLILRAWAVLGGIVVVAGSVQIWATAPWWAAVLATLLMGAMIAGLLIWARRQIMARGATVENAVER